MKILGREGEDRRMEGRFYVTVVQAVLLFGSETWFLIPRLDKYLEGFHHRKAHQMAGMVPNVNSMGHGCTHPLGRRSQW